jgi:hypothetical protein
MKADEAIAIENTVWAFLRHAGFQVDGEARELPSGVFHLELTRCRQKVFFLKESRRMFFLQYNITGGYD